MKVTARRVKRVWILTRCLLVAVPLIHLVGHIIARDWFGCARWLGVVVVVGILVLQERNAFHQGFHFGQIMIMWCIAHDISPEEFAEMPEPEPWDLPWSTKTLESDDDHGG